MCCVCKQHSSTSASRTESESSATAVAELAGKVADIAVADSCHGNTSLAVTAESESSQRDSNTAESDCCTDARHQVEKQLDAEDAVIPSPDEYFEEGMQ